MRESKQTNELYQINERRLKDLPSQQKGTKPTQISLLTEHYHKTSAPQSKQRRSISRGLLTKQRTVH